ncbi:MAG: Gfo/Idh/MocA family oxidoreductase [Thermoguttaceae bacterium]|nr:Gfo/Idh/MocA family oxidoreductase [Thermoguttaceae bacterium]
MSMNRRQFLKTSALSAAALGVSQFPAPLIAQAQNANSKLRIGVVGVSGRGAGNISELLNGSGDVVEIAALCDVDDNNLESQGKNHPNAKRFFDYRTMLDETELDAILISTPDHTHAVAAMAAMKKGLPCFCEKPLAHDVAEIRAMQKIAKEKNLATQMGTVIHATENYRRVVELIQAGAVGEVNEVHVWCAKGWGGYPEPSKEKFDVPKHLHWDEWLGPAQWLDYNPCYLPGRWRGYWPFGTGTFGDMACHLMDLPFWALDLQYPKTISATCDAEISKMCCPLDVECKYEFEVNGKTLPLTWYDGVRRPAVIKDKNLADLFMGVIFVGDEGILEADYGTIRLYPEERFTNYKRPEKSIPPSAGHHREWINSILDGGTTTALCNFEYSGRLTETVQLGAVSLRAGKINLEWDAEKMLVTNDKAANDFITTEYREGWSL